MSMWLALCEAELDVLVSGEDPDQTAVLQPIVDECYTDRLVDLCPNQQPLLRE